MHQIDKAVTLLKAGEVVGMPTETVYGLGASIDSQAGISKIFELKERPFFDPLIVHVRNAQQARTLVKDWNPIAQALAEHFWPGPLTLVCEKADSLNPMITAGLERVGIRCPSHPIALELIEKLGSPIAAPSANKFKKTSPTRREHVLKELGEEVFVLEGGNCEVGIESTVAGIFEDRVEIYRPGKITARDIKEVLKQNDLDINVEHTQSPVAPGQLKHHYMPDIPVILAWDMNEEQIRNKMASSREIAKITSRANVWVLKDDPATAARMLYQHFRHCQESAFSCIVIGIFTAYRQQEDWLGILNRLDKAKTLEIFP